MLRKLIAPILVAGTLSVGAAAPATAQTVQRGLVNVNVEDVTVQVPIAVAANICDVTVAVLVSDLRDDGSAVCDAFAESDATVTPRERGGPVVQDGLINVNISGVVIQVPIAAAVNLCDVTVAILATDLLDDGEATCDAVAGSGASG
ncbi:MAG TPA: hypothetical protein VE737_03945 [Actinomycetota bacterium]|jgi:hypothetical protein|nr:hypothetical protein [Actinomycetota bacterium]